MLLQDNFDYEYKYFYIKLFLILLFFSVPKKQNLLR